MPAQDSSLEEIKDRIDIVDFISEYVNLKKAGQNWKGLCPFHAEKTPSFTVSPAKQIYHCFGCGSGGDIFTFLVRYENLTFPEALSMLANKAGVELKTAARSQIQKGEKEVLLTMHREALTFFRAQLAKNTRALDYLNRRGIGSEGRESFSIGYAPKSWNSLLSHLTRKGYKPEAIRKSGLAVQSSRGFYDTFRDRILFPIHDVRGDVVAFGGRTLDGSEPKYLNSPDTPIFNKSRVLFGLNRAKDAIKEKGYALLMEGYLDVIMTHIHGFSNAAAPLGTALTLEQGKLIKRFTGHAVLAFDSDRAGIQAAKKAAGVLLESGLDVKILSVPENEDPDSFLRSSGKEAFSSLLEHPLNVIDFFIKQGNEKHVVADEVFDLIRRIPNEILQEEHIVMLSDKLNVNEQRVRDRFKKISSQRRAGDRRPSTGNTREKGVRKRPDNEELYLIQLLLLMPEKIKEVSRHVSVDDFRDALLRGIFRKMNEGLATVQDIVAKSEGEEKNLLTRISLEDDFEDPEKVLSDCIQRLRDNRQKLLLQELQGKIKEAERKKDYALLRQLQSEQIGLLGRGKK